MNETPFSPEQLTDPWRKVARRLWSKIDIRAPDQCWLWTRSTDVNGYGRINVERIPQLVHRVAFFLTHGVWPEAVLHKCDNPPCCNPAHLREGTRALNNADCVAKGRAHKARGEAAGKAVFDETTVRLIRLRAAAGEGIRAMAREYGVHHRSIGHIVNRRSWAHVE